LLSYQSQALRFQFGSLTYFRRPLKRYNLRSAPLIVGVQEGSQIWQRLASALIDAVKQHFSTSLDAIGVENVPLNSPFHQLLLNNLDMSQTFLPAMQASFFERQAILLPATLEIYLDQLGGEARKVLGHCRKRLLRDFADDVHVTCFKRESDVDGLLDIVSRITPHDLRISRPESRVTFAKRLHLAARHAWLRSYVLFCSGRPVAMMIGYQQDAHWQLTHTIVDPEYHYWSVGTTLMSEAIEDLYDRPSRPRLIILNNGFDDSKVGFANRERSEVDMLLLSRTTKHAFLAGAYKRLDDFTQFAASMADRINLGQELTKSVRKLSLS